MEFTCAHCADRLGMDFEPPTSVMSSCTYCRSGPTQGELIGALLQRLPLAATPESTGGPPGTPGEVLKAKEAARYLRLPSVHALYQAVRRGGVPARRVGKRTLRFLKSELDVLLRDPDWSPRA
jgi:excisionase family DNA binding protein